MQIRDWLLLHPKSSNSDIFLKQIMWIYEQKINKKEVDNADTGLYTLYILHNKDI